MTKQEFLSGLESALKRKGVADIPEIIADYNEHFEAGAASGKSEHQIIIELGAIESIANEYADSKHGAAYSQHFGNITNFYNGGTTTNPAEPTREGRRPVITATDKTAAATPLGSKKKDKKDTDAKEAGNVAVKILLGFVYFIGGIIIASVSLGLGIGAVATTISLVVSGIALSVSTWFIFGAFLVKLSGLFAGLALIMLGVLIGKVLFAAIALIKTIFSFIVNIFKKALKGVN